jgi:hypothetical protein
MTMTHWFGGFHFKCHIQVRLVPRSHSSNAGPLRYPIPKKSCLGCDFARSLYSFVSRLKVHMRALHTINLSFSSSSSRLSLLRLHSQIPKPSAQKTLTPTTAKATATLTTGFSFEFEWIS